MKRKVLSFLLVFVLLIGMVGCSGENAKETSSKEKGKVTKLNIGYAPGIGNMLCFIAEDKGYFKEENLEVELVPFTNSSDGLNALNGGKIDIGTSFGTAAPLTFITNGSDLSFFGGYLSGGHPIYASKEVAKNYKSLDDYKGKKVATARLYTPDIVWRSAMLDAGIDIKKDLEVIEMKKPTEVLEAVKSGKADIGIGTGSTYTKIKQAGLPIIDWSNNLGNDHVCCRLVSKTDYIKNNQDAMKSFLKAMIKAEKVWKDEPNYAVELNKKYLKLDETMAKEITLDTNQIIESDPKKNAIVDMWDHMSKIGYLEKKDIKIDDHINIELYKKALDEVINENPKDEFFKSLEKRYTEYNK